jgi:maltose O-acetyltransferase
MILPGVEIGNNVIIGASSVVAHNIPDGFIAVENPARVIRENIKMDNNAILIDD